MAGEWRTLKLELLAETKQFIKEMGDGEKTVQSFGDRAEKMGKAVGAAFAAAAAAAAVYAAKLAVDGVKAAIEDEAAQMRLAKALENTTGATKDQIAGVEEQISKMSLAFGVADDQLRPAFQRLATATGNLDDANKGLNLALDISAATGKSVEAVSNALGKAYEGNTGALGRLGIGISSADLKSMSLDETMGKLAETFGGQATVKANTLEGQIQRLKVGFDEAKEAVGAGLLPIVQKFMTYITDTLIPKLTKAKENAIDPIKNAFADNKAEMQALYEFGRDYLVPFFEKTLVRAIENAGKMIGTVINIIGAVVQGIETVVNTAIDGVNTVLKVWNAIPDFLKPGGDVKLLQKVDFVRSGVGQNKVASSSLPFGGGTVATPSTTTVPVVATPKVTPTSASSPSKDKFDPSNLSTPYMGSSLYNTITPIDFSLLDTGFAGSSLYNTPANVTVVVNAPSAIDQEGFKNAVVDALNEAENRGTGGGSALRRGAIAL